MNAATLEVSGSDAAIEAARQARGLAGDLLAYACEGNFAGARARLDELFALRGRFNAFTLLARIARGQIPVRRHGAIHSIGPKELQPDVGLTVEEALDSCASFIAIEPPIVLVECADDSALHLTTESFRGLATIRLAVGVTPERLRAAIHHEVAHACMSCGVRLVDEGFATFFAHRSMGDKPAEAPAVLKYSARTLLSGAAQRGVVFEGAGVDAAEAGSVREFGSRIVEAVYERRGAMGLKRLFHDLSLSATDAEVFQLVEDAVGVPLESLHASPPQVQQEREPCADAKQVIAAAWESESVSDIVAYIAKLEAAGGPSDGACLDALISCKTALVELQLHLGQAIAPTDLSRIDLLLEEARVLPASRLWAMRGRRALIALECERSNVLKLVANSKRALFAFKKALELDPKEADAVIGRALLYVHSPAAFGGDRARGIAMLESLRNDPFCGQYVGGLLEDLGKTTTPVTPADSAHATSSGGEPLIVLSNIFVKVSASFGLRIDQFEAKARQCVALIGPNGAGKSALIETLVGLRAIEAGSATVLGRPVACLDTATKQQLGCLLQHGSFLGPMRVADIVRLHRSLYPSASPQVATALALDEIRNAQFGNLSRGQAQRVRLYAAFAHQPAVVFLDEPSLGLDENFAHAFRQLLRAHAGAVVMVSHAISDIEAADEVVWLVGGRVRDSGTLESLRGRHLGDWKARILQDLPVPNERLQEIAGCKTIVRTEAGQPVLFGNVQFREGFRAFVDKHGIGAFSIEKATTSDLLSWITGAWTC